MNPRDLVPRATPVIYDPGVTTLNPPGIVEVLHKDREGPGIDVLEIRTPIEVRYEQIDELGQMYIEVKIEWVTEMRTIHRDIGQEVQSPMKSNHNQLAEEDRTPKGQIMTQASPEKEPLNIESEPQRGSAIRSIPTRVVEEGDNNDDDSDDEGCYPAKLRCCCCKKKDKNEPKKDPNWFERWFCCKKTAEEEKVEYKNERLTQRIDESIDVVNMVRDFNFTKIMVHYLFDNRHFSTAQHAGFELWRQEDHLKQKLTKLAKKDLKQKKVPLKCYNKTQLIKERVREMELENFFDSVLELKKGITDSMMDVYQYDSQTLDGFFQDSVYKKKKRTTIVNSNLALMPQPLVQFTEPVQFVINPKNLREGIERCEESIRDLRSRINEHLDKFTTISKKINDIAAANQVSIVTTISQPDIEAQSDALNHIDECRTDLYQRKQILIEIDNIKLALNQKQEEH